MRIGGWADARRGVRTAALVVTAIAWLALAAVAVGLASHPNPGRKLLGWGLLLAAAAIAILTAHIWARILPGIIGLGVLNAAIALFSGHLAADPSHTLPRPWTAVALVALMTCAALATTYASRPLVVVDRFALVGYLAWTGVAIALYPSLAGFLLMPVVLGVGWLNNKIQGSGERAGRAGHKKRASHGSKSA